MESAGYDNTAVRLDGCEFYGGFHRAGASIYKYLAWGRGRNGMAGTSGAQGGAIIIIILKPARSTPYEANKSAKKSKTTT